MLPDHPIAICAEAERLIDLAAATADEEASYALSQQARDLLLPLVERGIPHAQYLHACCTLGLDAGDHGEFEQQYYRLIEAAARSGHPIAQFRMGQAYDEGGDLGHNAEESARWFQASAEQGYPYAQWVHGCNLLHGSGIAKNEPLGLESIHRAAEGRFEGAIQFLSNAYAKGLYGYPKDESLAEKWRSLLREPGLIEY